MDFATTTRDVRELFVSCELARARAARSWGRSSVELSALVHIYLTDGVTPHAIASRLSLTTGSVTALLDRLQGAGLIARNANPEDRRSLLIVGTAAGSLMAHTFLSTLDSVVAKAVGDLDAGVLEQFNGVLRAVALGMDSHRPVALSEASLNGRAH